MSDYSIITIEDSINPIVMNTPTSDLIELVDHDFIIYPNPTNGVFNCEFISSSNQYTRFKVFDVHGKLINEKMQQVKIGYNKINFDLTNQSNKLANKAVLFIVFEIDNKKVSKEFIFINDQN